jgi:hypothetical protein
MSGTQQKTLLEFWIKEFLLMKVDHIFNRVVKILLSEQPRWKREKVDLKHPYNQIGQKYLGQPNVYFTMTNYNKLGIYPRSAEDSGPLGIYCYPLTSQTFHQLVNNELPYASERAFVNFFRAKNPSKVLSLSLAQSGWGESPTEDEVIYEIIPKLHEHEIKDKKKPYNLRSVIDMDSVEKNYLKNKRGGEPPAYTFYRTIKDVVNRSAIRWTTTLMKAGFDGVLDMGNGYIFTGEPTQAVFFSSAALEPLEVAANPFSSINTSSPINALSPYSPVTYDGLSASYTEDNTKPYSVMKSTKLRFEVLLGKELKATNSDESEFWNNPGKVLAFYKKTKELHDETGEMVLQKIPQNILLSILPSFGRGLKRGEERALINRLSIPDLMSQPPGLFYGHDLKAIEQKFKNNPKEFIDFIINNNVSQGFDRVPPEELMNVLGKTTDKATIREICRLFFQRKEFRSRLMTHPNPLVRTFSIYYLSDEDIAKMIEVETDPNVLDILLRKAPLEQASNAKMSDVQAGNIFLTRALQLSNSYAIKIFFEIYEKRNHSEDFAIKVISDGWNMPNVIADILPKINPTVIKQAAIITQFVEVFNVLIKHLTAQEIFDVVHANEHILADPENFLYNDNFKKDFLVLLSKSEHSTFRLRAALQLRSPEIDELSHDKSALVRKAVAQLSSNKEVLNSLLNDDSYQVKYEASGRLNSLE